MAIAITVIHVIACLFLIGVVLLQQGKGADMGAVFGGSSQTIFGGGGAGNFLTRLTAAAAVTFMLTSLSLTYTSARSVTATVFDDAPVPSAPLPMQDEMPPLPDEGGVAPQAQPAAGEPIADAEAAAEDAGAQAEGLADEVADEAAAVAGEVEAAVGEAVEAAEEAADSAADSMVEEMQPGAGAAPPPPLPVE